MMEERPASTNKIIDRFGLNLETKIYLDERGTPC